MILSHAEVGSLTLSGGECLRAGDLLSFSSTFVATVGKNVGFSAIRALWWERVR